VPRATSSLLPAQLNSLYMYNVSPLSARSRFCFNYCEMRASNLGLVIATGCCLLWGVKAQVHPSDSGLSNPLGITTTATTSTSSGPFDFIVPTPTLFPGQVITVSWQDPPSCFIAGVAFIARTGNGEDAPSTISQILRKLNIVPRPGSKKIY
jgi:hypothetical protein